MFRRNILPPSSELKSSILIFGSCLTVIFDYLKICHVFCFVSNRWRDVCCYSFNAYGCLSSWKIFLWMFLSRSKYTCTECTRTMTPIGRKCVFLCGFRWRKDCADKILLYMSVSTQNVVHFTSSFTHFTLSYWETYFELIGPSCGP
jgi:hypothetical protein